MKIMIVRFQGRQDLISQYIFSLIWESIFRSYEYLSNLPENLVMLRDPESNVLHFQTVWNFYWKVIYGSWVRSSDSVTTSFENRMEEGEGESPFLMPTWLKSEIGISPASHPVVEWEPVCFPQLYFALSIMRKPLRRTWNYLWGREGKGLGRVLATSDQCSPDPQHCVLSQYKWYGIHMGWTHFPAPCEPSMKLRNKYWAFCTEYQRQNGQEQKWGSERESDTDTPWLPWQPGGERPAPKVPSSCTGRSPAWRLLVMLWGSRRGRCTP